MRALVPLCRPLDLERVSPGAPFDAPAARACGYLVLGMAALVERPAWWAAHAPTGPPDLERLLAELLDDGHQHQRAG